MIEKLTDLLDSSRVAYKRPGEHHHVREGWLGLDCPSCGKGTSTFRMGLNIQSFAFHCWKCGRIDSKEALKSLGIDFRAFWTLRRAGISVPGRNIARNEGGSLREPSGRGALQRIHREYLRERDFEPDELVRVWGLEGIGLAAKLRWSIYIPITRFEQTVSWTTRTLKRDAERRYISASPEQELVHHKHMLYGSDLCAHTVIIVEGPADAWRVGPGACALLGAAYTTAQLKLLSAYPRRFICLDTDARLQALRLAGELSCFPGRTELIELDAEDPGSASRREIRKLREACGLR